MRSALRTDIITPFPVAFSGYTHINKPLEAMLGRIFLDERILGHGSFELSFPSETPVSLDVSSMFIFHFL